MRASFKPLSRRRPASSPPFNSKATSPPPADCWRRAIGAGRVGQATVEHIGHRRMLAQQPRHAQRRFAVTLHAQLQRLQAAQHQEGGEGDSVAPV